MPTNESSLRPLPEDAALIRSKDVPSYIGVAAQTLARWRHEGSGPMFVKLGRLVFYRAADLRTWITAQCRQNTVQ